MKKKLKKEGRKEYKKEGEIIKGDKGIWQDVLESIFLTCVVSLTFTPSPPAMLEPLSQALTLTGEGTAKPLIATPFTSPSFVM